MNVLTDDDALDTFKQVLARILQRLEAQRRQNKKPPSRDRKSSS